MGAVTTLLYSNRDPSIAGIVSFVQDSSGEKFQSQRGSLSMLLSQVVDSPFSKLTDLMFEVVDQQKLPVPRTLLKVG